MSNLSNRYAEHFAVAVRGNTTATLKQGNVTVSVDANSVAYKLYCTIIAQHTAADNTLRITWGNYTTNPTTTIHIRKILAALGVELDTSISAINRSDITAINLGA